MTFEGLEKTPEVAPLLVRLYDTHSLYSLAGNTGNEEACAELTDVMVDLLNITLSDRESELITDVLLALMKQAETDLKAALAERLSTMPGVPLRMVLSLANDEIAIADVVLRNSPVLQDLDLIYILQAKGVEHGRSISNRHGLSGTIIDMLADIKDFQIAVNLANNDGVNLTEHAYRIFGDMARYSDVLAKPLLVREDLPQDVAGKLYQFVNNELKKVLKQRFGIGGDVAAYVLDSITEEVTNLVIPVEKDNHDELVAFAHNQNRRGELKVSGMIATLRRGQYSTFLAQFSVFCGLPVATMKAVLKQETGKGLAIACKAKDIQKSDYVSLFLLCERFRSGAKKVVNHKELTRIMGMFDEIDVEKARQILMDSRH